MPTNRIAMATITWARSKEEEELLCKSLQHLAELPIDVFITDADSPSAFLAFLRSKPRFTVLQAKGVWAQAKKSLQAAYQAGAQYVFYTEPDKADFFRHSLTGMLREVPQEEKRGILLASRSEAGFASFPSFQRMSEKAINNCCAEVIGKELDYTYGPFLLPAELIPYLEGVQEEIGWGWRPLCFGIAYRLGYPVKGFIRDFSCPPEQSRDTPSERLYRMRQLKENIQGLLLSTTISLQAK